VLRAKILFSNGVRKTVTPKFNRRPASSGMARMMDMFVSEAGDDYQIRDHGSDIYTLIQKILKESFFP
jgi:hypothetical protein